MAEENKRPQTMLGNVGDVLQPLKPVVDVSARLLESLLGEPMKVAGGMLADQIYIWQLANRVRIVHKAKKMLEERKVDPRILPKGFLLPLLQAAGDAEEPSLQELWARLLANGVENARSCHPGFVDALG